VEILIEYLGRGLLLSLLLSLPCVLVAAAVGLVVGILQAVTQVQEQTIAAAPKIISVFLVILLGGGLMMELLSDYIREAVLVAFTHIPQDGLHLLPPKPNQQAGHQRARDFFKVQSKGNLGDSKLKEFLTGWQMPKDTSSPETHFRSPAIDPNRSTHAEKLFLKQPQKP
jgi:flagellar biosynthesis protein FliQ